MKRSKLFVLFFVISAVLAFTWLFNSLRSCVLGLGWRSLVQSTNVISVCFTDEDDVSTGHLRWGHTIQLGDYGFIGSLWIQNATILTINTKQDYIDLFVGYKLDDRSRIAKLPVHHHVNFSVDDELNGEENELVMVDDLPSRLSPGDVVTIGLTFIPRRSPLVMDGYKEYLSGRFKGEDLAKRLKKIELYADMRFDESEVESLLSRNFVNLDTTGILVGTITKKVQK